MLIMPRNLDKGYPLFLRTPAYLWNSSDEIHEIQKTNYRIAARTGRPPPKNTRGKGGRQRRTNTESSYSKLVKIQDSIWSIKIRGAQEIVDTQACAMSVTSKQSGAKR